MRECKHGCEITCILIGYMYVLSDTRFDWLVGNMFELLLTRPRMFKRWITLSNGEITIQPINSSESNRPFSKMAPTEGGLETGGIEYLQHGRKRARRNATEREFHYRYFGLREQVARKQKGLTLRTLNYCFQLIVAS